MTTPSKRLNSGSRRAFTFPLILPWISSAVKTLSASMSEFHTELHCSLLLFWSVHVDGTTSEISGQAVQANGPLDNHDHQTQEASNFNPKENVALVWLGWFGAGIRELKEVKRLTREEAWKAIKKFKVLKALNEWQTLMAIEEMEANDVFVLITLAYMDYPNVVKEWDLLIHVCQSRSTQLDKDEMEACKFLLTKTSIEENRVKEFLDAIGKLVPWVSRSLRKNGQTPTAAEMLTYIGTKLSEYERDRLQKVILNWNSVAGVCAEICQSEEAIRSSQKQACEIFFECKRSEQKRIRENGLGNGSKPGRAVEVEMEPSMIQTKKMRGMRKGKMTRSMRQLNLLANLNE